MNSASQLLHARLGAPMRPDCADVPATPCWVCGGMTTRGAAREKWLGANFTGQNNVRAWASSIVCEACLCVMSWETPAVMPLPGKIAKANAKRDPNWRNYSVLVDTRGVLVCSKGEKPAIRDWLRIGPHGEWFAAIADSGQKHVVPWTPVNPSGATLRRVRFEDRDLVLGDWLLADDMTALLTAGASKETLVTGDYTPGQWQLCGPALEAFELRWSSARASAWFELALWLSQRDEAAVAARMEETKNARRKTKQGDRGVDGAGVARGARGVSRKRREPHETLGPATGPRAERGAQDSDSGGVVDAPAPVATTAVPQPRQRTLF